jgi:hypothetical protein
LYKQSGLLATPGLEVLGPSKGGRSGSELLRV